MRLLPGRKLMTVGASLARNYLARESIYPFYASFKVTHKCNFRCKFCNVWKEDTPDLTTEEVCEILDDLGESSILVTGFEGGDPLLRCDRQCGWYQYFATASFTTAGDVLAALKPYYSDIFTRA